METSEGHDVSMLQRCMGPHVVDRCKYNALPLIMYTLTFSMRHCHARFCIPHNREEDGAMTE